VQNQSPDANYVLLYILSMNYVGTLSTALCELCVSFRHKNIITLYGCSTDGPSVCLIYEFMVNGSLLDRLTRRVRYHTQQRY